MGEGLPGKREGQGEEGGIEGVARGGKGRGKAIPRTKILAT